MAGRNHFQCRTCPYQMPLAGVFYEKKQMVPKEVEDVLGGADSWKNVDKVPGMFLRVRHCSCTRLTSFAVPCVDPGCSSQQAYFRQVQIRSADEPMTTFYKVY